MPLVDISCLIRVDFKTLELCDELKLQHLTVNFDLSLVAFTFWIYLSQEDSSHLLPLSSRLYAEPPSAPSRQLYQRFGIEDLEE